MFEFDVAVVDELGAVWHAASTASKPPEKWNAPDLSRVLQALSLFIGLELPDAFLEFRYHGTGGITFQVGGNGRPATAGPFAVARAVAEGCSRHAERSVLIEADDAVH